ncbi:MAG: hypothetical protein LBQ51_01620 [Desulfovibrio sp.]|jgi:hypothetical protein|nr:hypothetical protein [Desulfovibrio sp.]
MASGEKQTYPDPQPDYTCDHASGGVRHQRRVKADYDPEMLYVECRVCGKPVLWETGKTTELLLSAGVDVSKLDERCMILSEGCPSCSPDESGGFTLAVVRIAGLTPEEAVYMARPGGNA